LASTEYRGTPDGFDSAWREPTPAEMPPGYPAMVEALRAFQDALAGAVPPDDLVAAVTSDLTRLAAELGRHQVPDREQLAGRLVALPGRGQAMAPALHVEELDPDHVRGHVTFGRFFVGGNGAAHGGAIALIFDEMMGRLANTERRPARTAYLHVNYRSVTPLDRVLHAEARLDRLDGRKRFLSASLRDGELICADAEGLFVELRPGQA
jgi:acyl-coenzyme A thioesterase PaaI-like protein